MSSSSLVPDLTASLTAAAFITLMIAAAVSDARTLRIPNAIPLAAILVFALAFVAGDFRPLLPHLISFGLAATVGGALFLTGVWGGGDAKLLASIAVFLRPGDLSTLALSTALAGGVVAIFAVLERKVRARAEAPALIPYGIAIAAGGLNWCFTAG